MDPTSAPAACTPPDSQLPPSSDIPDELEPLPDDTILPASVIIQQEYVRRYGAGNSLLRFMYD